MRPDREPRVSCPICSAEVKEINFNAHLAWHQTLETMPA